MMVFTATFSPLASIPIESDHNTPKKQLRWFNSSKSIYLRRSLNLKVDCTQKNLVSNDFFSNFPKNNPKFIIKMQKMPKKFLNIPQKNEFRVMPERPDLLDLPKILSGLNLFFGAITTIFTEKTNKRNSNNIIEELGISGYFLEKGLVFCQNFSIRSYEVGADGTISMETIISYLQDTVLNHLKVTGLLGDGLGSTSEMCIRKLIWVSTKMQIVVDHYPTWGDNIRVENRIVLSRKHTVRRDSIIRDNKTGEILVRATCNWVMMNKETRRLCRFPDEVREEMSPFCKDAPPTLEEDGRKLPKLDNTSFDHVCSGLKPRWSDLDINEHVNNAKYIGWILASAPESTLKSHKLSRMTLEYKRECQRETVLQSMTAASSDDVEYLSYPNSVEYNHLLKLEDGADIVKARTEWIPK